MHISDECWVTNLSNISLPALVLLRKGVLLKQSTLVGRAPSTIHVIQDSCYGYCCGITLLRDVSHWSVVTVQLMLRDGSQQGTGVREVSWSCLKLEHKRAKSNIELSISQHFQRSCDTEHGDT